MSPKLNGSRLLLSLLFMVKNSFFNSLYKKRTLGLGIFLATPALLAIVWLINVDDPRPLEDFANLYLVLYLHILIPLISLLLGIDLFNSEFKSRTISYMFTRPTPRWVIYVGKIMGLYLAQLILILFSVSITFILMVSKGHNTGYLDDLGGFLVLSALATLGYTTFFTLLGIQFKQPMIIGLIVAFFYEKTISTFPTSIAKATLLFYFLSAGKSLIDVAPFSNRYHTVGLSTALVTVGIFVLGVGILSVLILNRKEVR